MLLPMKRTGNGKSNRESFDSDVRSCANIFVQDDAVSGLGRFQGWEGEDKQWQMQKQEQLPEQQQEHEQRQKQIPTG